MAGAKGEEMELKPAEVDNEWYVIEYPTEEGAVYSDRIYSFEQAVYRMRQLQKTFNNVRLFYNMEISMEIEIT
jgi:hypothetical protein